MNPGVAVGVEANPRPNQVVRMIVLVVEVDAMIGVSTLRCTRFEGVRGPY